MTRGVEVDVLPCGVATITLAGATPLNIYNVDMRDELIEAFGSLALHPDVRALVIKGKGQHLSSGADLREFGSAPSILDGRRIRWQRDPWIPLLTMPYPTIASLKGYSLGAGLEMALLCDLRIAGRDVIMGLPEMDFGMLPAAGGTQTLSRAIGVNRALPLVLLAERLDAERARQLGIVSHVAEDPDGLAIDAGRRIAQLEPAVVRATTKLVRLARDVRLEQGLALERLIARQVQVDAMTSTALRRSLRLGVGQVDQEET
jgi:enoyl-CoA hydratase/carnithine racemase